ncbi:TPA: hypothetical protein DEB29_04945 [Candidatus Wolfebacteria bacterium]|nr:hypothetical protein [Candidatus Wolfebacteria bacterium]
MKKLLVVGRIIPQELLERLKGGGVQANVMRFPEQHDFQETLRTFEPDAAVFLWPSGQEETTLQTKLIDDHMKNIPTLVLSPALWQRYAQAEEMDIHIGAISEPRAILEWVHQVSPGHT